MRNSFHQVSVSAKSKGKVVYHLVAVLIVLGSQMTFSHGHTNSHTDSLTQWSCGGFYTYGVTILRMTRGLGAPLSEVLQLFHGQIISSYMKHGIKKCRPMSCREDKTVSVEPGRILWIVHHVLSP